MNSIFHRVSIRKYMDKAVEEEKIEKILRAAFAAPSAQNQQPWEFYVVTKKELIEKLSGVSPYSGCLSGAPLAIVSCYYTNSIVPRYAQIDLSAATENILLEADELGLGAVWLGIAPVEERMNKVREILDIPEELTAFSIVAVGYPAESRAQKDRFKPERVHIIQ